jgi:hypothetical protein
MFPETPWHCQRVLEKYHRRESEKVTIYKKNLTQSESFVVELIWVLVCTDQKQPSLLEKGLSVSRGEVN